MFAMDGPSVLNKHCLVSDYGAGNYDEPYIDKQHIRSSDPALISALQMDLQDIWPQSSEGFCLSLWLSVDGGYSSESERRKFMQKNKFINPVDTSDNCE